MSELPQSGESGEAMAPRKRIGPLQLFLLFSQVAMIGFGGVAPFVYHMLVEKKRLLPKAEFAEYFAFGQILPGPAVGNLALIIGYRDSGAAGAAASVAGMMTFPMLLMMLVGYFYEQYADLAEVKYAIAGMATVTAGLILATGLKLSTSLPRRLRSLLLLLAAFVGFGLLRLPFLAIIGVLAPTAVWLAWRDQGPEDKAEKEGSA